MEGVCVPNTFPGDDNDASPGGIRLFLHSRPKHVNSGARKSCLQISSSEKDLVLVLGLRR